MKSGMSRVLPLLLVVAVLLVGCVDQGRLKEKDEQIANLEQQLAVWEGLADSQGLLLKALQTVELIKGEDFTGLSAVVHPTKGLRFTPYPFVDLDEDQVFTAQQVAGLPHDDTVYLWGNYDGSGEPINLTFSEYYERFVYDHDFVNPQIIGNNHIVSSGNTLDNVKAAYPLGKFVELYFEGFNPEFSGIDWSSLKLVFEQQDGVWYLVGIVHGQWTI